MKPHALLGRLVLIIAGLSVSLPTLAKDTWLRVTTPDFEIFTDLQMRDAIARATEFSQFMATLRTRSAPGAKRAPLTMVVFRHAEDFRPYQPKNDRGKRLDVPGYFVPGYSWAISALTADSRGAGRAIVFHESVHWMITTPERPIPPWINEGLAELFSTFEVVDGRARWGMLPAGRMRWIKEHEVQSFQELITTSQSELLRFQDDRMSAFYSTAWSAMHLVFFGQSEFSANAVARYQDFVATGKAPMDAFSEAFGCTVEEFERRLRNYQRSDRFRGYEGAAVPVAAPAVEVSPEAALTEALGRLAFSVRNSSLARQQAEKLLLLAPDAPRAHALMGSVLRAQGDQQGAVVEFSDAVRLGSRDMLAFSGLAANGRKELVDYFAPVPATTARQQVDWLEQAIDLCPTAEFNYEELAILVSHVETPTALDRDCLARGARIFPRNQVIQLGLAEVHYQAGEIGEGETIFKSVRAKIPASSKQALTYAELIARRWAQP